MLPAHAPIKYMQPREGISNSCHSIERTNAPSVTTLGTFTYEFRMFRGPGSSKVLNRDRDTITNKVKHVNFAHNEPHPDVVRSTAYGVVHFENPASVVVVHLPRMISRGGPLR